jgi:tRNA threonylcarbamoyladenosine biosynthesis protein TsaB
MITLALDTSEKRGSIVVRVDGRCVGQRLHLVAEDYSSWLLPAVEDALGEARKAHADLELLAVSTGPGSFTGVRMGLCAVKAWAEVYDKPVVGVSRLEAMARGAVLDGLISVTYDAHRGQVFGALYQREAGKLRLLGAEMVIAPADFLGFVIGESRNAPVQWRSLDPDLFTGLGDWKSRELNGFTMERLSAELANSIGEIAEERAARGELTDVLQLDANYVRRADAEILWKGPANRVG